MNLSFKFIIQILRCQYGKSVEEEKKKEKSQHKSGLQIRNLCQIKVNFIEKTKLNV